MPSQHHERSRSGNLTRCFHLRHLEIPSVCCSSLPSSASSVPAFICGLIGRFVLPSIMLIVLFCLPAAAQSAGRNIAGTVRNKDGAPIEGARVVACQRAAGNPALNEVAAEITTDAAGGFAFAGIAPMDEAGSMRLIYAHKNGYSWGSMSGYSTEPKEYVDIVLYPPAKLSGRIVDTEGTGLAGATVEISMLSNPANGGAEQRRGARGLPFLSAVSGEDGSFIIEDLPEGFTAVLRVSAPKGLADYVERVRPGRKDRTVPVDEVKITLRPEGIIRGKLVHAATGDPASNFPLQVEGTPTGLWTSRTEENGTFEFRQLPEGRYHFSTWENFNFPGILKPKSVILRYGATVEADLQWEEGNMLSVRVFTISDGLPQKDCLVRIREMNGRYSRVVRIDDGGRAAVHVPAGRMHLTVENSDGATESRSIDVAEGEKSAEFRLPAAQAIVNLFVHDKAGHPIAEAAVINDFQQLSKTDSSGRARIRGMREDRDYPCAILVRHEESRRAALFILPAEGAVDVLLDDAGTVTGTVKGEDGQLLSEARVALYTRTDGGYINGLMITKSDSKGSFSFEGIPAGHKYEVNASKNGFGRTESARWDKDLATTEVRDIGPVVLQAARKMRGVILQADGTPIKNCQVFAQTMDEQIGHASTDNEGRFEIDNITPVAVYLQVSHGANYIMREVLPKDFDNIEVVFFGPFDREDVLRVGSTAPRLADVEWIAGSEPEKTQQIIAFVSIRNPGARRLMDRLASLPEGWSAVCVHDSGVSAEDIRNYLKEKALQLNVARVTEEKFNGMYSRPFLDYKVQTIPAIVVAGQDRRVENTGIQLEELEAILR